MSASLHNTVLTKTIISHAELLKAKPYLIRGVMNQKRGMRISKEYITKEKPLTGL